MQSDDIDFALVANQVYSLYTQHRVLLNLLSFSLSGETDVSRVADTSLSTIVEF